VRLPRLVLTAVYIGYLVQVGLLMIIVPWSTAWRVLMTRIPPPAAWLLDDPAARGALTALGVLHLLLVVAEVVHAGARERRTPPPPSPARARAHDSREPPGA
jgi:hypothetical protein